MKDIQEIKNEISRIQAQADQFKLHHDNFAAAGLIEEANGKMLSYTHCLAAISALVWTVA